MRKTKPVEKIPAMFVRDPDYSGVRTKWHLEHFPDYPDPIYNLSIVGHYLFRNEKLQHLRIEQFIRYCSLCDRGGPQDQRESTMENTMDDEDVQLLERDHRHYD